MTHYQIIIHFSHENLAGCQSDLKKRSKLPSQINSDLTYLSFAIEIWPLNTWCIYCFSLLLMLYTNGLYFIEKLSYLYQLNIWNVKEIWYFCMAPSVGCSLCVSYILLFCKEQDSESWDIEGIRGCLCWLSIAGVCKRSQTRKYFKHYCTWAFSTSSWTMWCKNLRCPSKCAWLKLQKH